MAKDSQRPKEWVACAAPAPRDIGAALATMSEDDLLRLRAIARLRARQGAHHRLVQQVGPRDAAGQRAGARPWPPGVPLLTFLAGVMRSLCDEQWRRRRRLDTLPAIENAGGTADPERVYAAAEALAAIHRLFATDMPATRVITGLLDGMTADEIRRHYGLSAPEYDTARRRIRRTLLRHGLTWSWP